ncbi:uncharacterized protein [Nicotiana tomentosiformis]|uniref:uncharacterized protein n=1 Tax=Nicotiana tomentosiformis TaxID=4098 RepID=UPI00388C657F
MEYEMRFTELSQHAAFLIPMEVEKVKRFIEGLNFCIKIYMAREAESGTTFLKAVDITHMIECIRVLFYLGSTYSYMSSLFSSYLNLPCGSLDILVHVSTPVGDSIMVDQDRRMVEKGCLTYLAFVRDVSDDTYTVESVLVVREFPDVFPTDIPGIPPDRDIDFGINLVPATQPISIPSYRMILEKLKELKE